MGYWHLVRSQPRLTFPSGSYGEWCQGKILDVGIHIDTHSHLSRNVLCGRLSYCGMAVSIFRSISFQLACCRHNCTKTPVMIAHSWECKCRTHGSAHAGRQRQPEPHLIIFARLRHRLSESTGHASYAECRRSI